MRHFLEYEFRHICLRFLLDDRDLPALFAILSELPFPHCEMDSPRHADVPRRRAETLPVHSPALNTWLYLISTDIPKEGARFFEFPSLPQARSLLCQQLRAQTVNSPHAGGQLQADDRSVDRVIVEIHLGERPYLVALNARQWTKAPIDDAVVFFSSVITSLQQVAEVSGPLPERTRAAVETLVADRLADLQNDQHRMGLESATGNLLRRAADSIVNQDKFDSEREDQAMHFLRASVPEEGQQGFEAFSSGGALSKILHRLVRLEELESNFNVALQEEKIAALKQLAYGASHEINNPLGNIATRSQTLMRGETDPERRRQLAMIVSQAYRAHDMISDMMLFAHPPTLQPANVSLRDAASRAVGDLQAMADQQQTRIVLDCESDCTDLFADADHLVMLVKALCQNALESCVAGGEVTVTISELVADDGKCFFRVDVADDGTGLSESARRHLFDPFYSGREAGRGLGLGLSKAWTIAQLHAGRIEVSGGNELGTKFSVFLPAVAVSRHA